LVVGTKISDTKLKTEDRWGSICGLLKSFGGKQDDTSSLQSGYGPGRRGPDLMSDRRRASHPGRKRRPGDDEEDSSRRNGAFAGNGNAELADRRPRPAPDQFASVQGGVRMGQGQADRVGVAEREPRSVGAVRTRMVSGGLHGQYRQAQLHPADRIPEGL